MAPPNNAMKTCPLCASSHFADHHFGLLRCIGCGLIMDRRAFAPQLDRALNEEAFGDQYEPQRSFWVRWFETVKSRRYLANLRRAGVTQGRLLEIGVGSGSFLDAARKAGFEPMGCDLSRSLATRVTQRTGIPVHCGDLAALPRHAFDIVCMHHVLEHVSDPVGFLQIARERLTPGGTLHVTVPNVSCWEAKFPGWNCYAYYHLTYFDATTLRRALESARFVVVRIGSHESFSAWFLTLVRTAAGIRSSEAPSTLATNPSRKSHWRFFFEHPYRLAMVGSGLLIWPLRWLQERFGHGDELLAVARSEE
jgi:2-polyprenyl-3-methyl-5-hydroxy-6-metoxy-1,4-benzoquinol methylase